MNTPRDSDMDQDENSAAASFAHSLAVAPLDTANTIHNISVALGNGDALSSGAASNSSATGVDVLMTDVTAAVQSNIAAMEQQSQLQPAESRMAVAELLVSLGQHTHGPAQGAGASAHASSGTGHLPMKQQSPIYRNAVDYVGSVKKAYENNPKVYTEFLTALEQYHGTSLQIDQLVRTVMGLFQDQPDLLLGFKEFLPEAQGLMNQLVPPMMYSDYKGNAAKSPVAAQQISPVAGTPQGTQQEGNINSILNNGHAAADFLSLIKEKSQQEPDMYQHLITLLRKFQKEHSYANLYFYVSIILRYHPHLLQRFHKFLPSVTSDTEVKEPRFISKAPPEELVVSPDFIEAKDFVQTVKYAAKNDMSMYDRFIFALEKYQRNGWTIDQVYSEVSLIFWNHPDALAGFKLFISSVPPPSQP